MFFEVIPTAVYRSGGGALTYRSDQPLLPGHLVLIPLGKRSVLGIVLKRVKKADFPTKPITKLLHHQPLPHHLLKSILWLSDYYLSPLPSVANLVLPAGLLSRNAFKAIPSRESKEYLPHTSSHIALNTHQKSALKALENASGTTRLLQGVTGSGKTNIYLKLTEKALKRQKSVILLVPEIALTSQLVQIFKQTFGDRIVLMHSNQTLVERRNTWLNILDEGMRERRVENQKDSSSQKPLIVIGPRSALFAPLSNLGLIIIDEAHESAYYQENTPHYSAPRLASFIAKTLDIPCIEGTATPSIVDYHLAKTHHSLITLDQKAKSTALDPKIQIVDLKNRPDFSKNRYFSDLLLTKIDKTIKAKHQTLIFHNRRGSAPLTLCEECGWQALCPECYLPMVLHADGYLLTCHVCGHEEKVPSSCPNCGHPGIVHKGFGTKLLESELKRFFPKAKIARFDGDNEKSSSLAHLYSDVKTGKIDILIGTQTLARGLDLPLLATIGIVQADSGLSLPDFAAEERTFELLTQVIGRVGRGHLNQADVVVQTYQPDHPVIKSAIHSDFAAFSDYLLKRRRAANLPPFSYIAKLAVTYKTEKSTLRNIQSIYKTLIQNQKLHVSVAMPAFHERTTRGYTWQIVLKSSSRKALREALSPYTKFQIELDPPSLL